VIFDMDGTLIEPLIDFAALREELGIDPRDGILESIERMPADQGRAARAHLLGRELAAARQAQLLPGAVEVCRKIRQAGMKTALLTRNAREAVQIVLERFDRLRFDLTRSREYGPIKPGPDGVLRACEALEADPSRTACVGDFHYDITAANEAGAVSILLIHGSEPDYAEQADHRIHSLHELPGILGI